MFLASSSSRSSYRQGQPRHKPHSTKSRDRERESPHQDVPRSFGWRPESYTTFSLVASNFEQTSRQSSRRAAAPAHLPNLPEKPMPTSGTGLPHSSTHKKPAASKAISIPSPARNHVASHAPKMPEHRPAKYTNHRHGANPHDSKAMRPEVAALLAMTSIQGRKKFPQRRQPRVVTKELTVDELMQEWRKEELESSSLGSNSPNMDILLSPPEEEHNYVASSSPESLPEFSYHSRTESNDSVPSLVTDDSSVRNASSDSSLDESLLKSLNRRKTSSPSPETTQSHPLQTSWVDEDVDIPESGYSSPRSSISTPHSESTDASSTRPKITPRQPSFYSSLSARLQALRASKSQQPDSKQRRTPLPGVCDGRPFSLPWSNEIFPKFDRPPSPETRRYLNPQNGPSTVSSPQRELYMHTRPNDTSLDKDTWSEADLRALEASRNEGCLLRADDLLALDSLIPMQSCIGRSKPSKRLARRRSDFGDPRLADGQLKVQEMRLPQRHREPRENGDFLRVCVLEMRMRRAGKFDIGRSRARWWLPPRGHGPDDDEESKIERNRASRDAIPKRWQGVTA